jgi:CheY-like chemotaxis protein/HPt (histidine-containing phosphotransfer) domain-containing protein
VESVFGRGSTFHFTVPVQIADAAWRSRLEAMAQLSGSAVALPTLPPGLRVLLAEDNRFNQEMVLELLGDVGVAVDVVENGLEALQRLRQSDYSLVLMDMMMPEMDGLEASRRIREEARWATLPVVALTANAGLEDRQRCLAAGMNDVLTKPFESADLYRVLQTYVRSSPVAEAARQEPVPTLVLPTSPPANGDGLPALPGIDEVLLLRRMKGRVGSARRLLGIFREQYGDAPIHVRNLLDEAAYGELYRFAHTLKGAAGGLAAIELEQAAQALESLAGNAAGSESDPAALAGAVDALLAPLQKVLAGLRAV